MRRKISQPQFGPSSIVEQNMKQKASNMGISRTPDPEKKSKLQKRHSSNQIQRRFIMIDLLWTCILLLHMYIHMLYVVT